jgi:hypothetical protein
MNGTRPNDGVTFHNDTASAIEFEIASTRYRVEPGTSCTIPRALAYVVRSRGLPLRLDAKHGEPPTASPRPRRLPPGVENVPAATYVRERLAMMRERWHSAMVDDEEEGADDDDDLDDDGSAGFEVVNRAREQLAEQLGVTVEQLDEQRDAGRLEKFLESLESEVKFW